MDIMEAIQNRHSVRQYEDKEIEPEKRGALDALVAEINRETGLHIQILYDEPKCFAGMMARYGRFSGVKNYVALVGRKSEALDETLGYHGERIVLRAQALGLNTCWVAMTHGKSGAEIRKGERQVCLIALGYGCTQGISHRSKALKEVSDVREDAPDWYKNAIRAALLAPTAMNQQKFHFALRSNGSVRASCDRGFYTKLDLGIVKCHFEIGAGRKVPWAD